MEQWKEGTAKLKKSACLNCGTLVTAADATDGSGRLPHPGDPTVCIRCGAVMVLADDYSLRGMTDAEIAELTANQPLMNEIARAVQKIRLIHAEHN